MTPNSPTHNITPAQARGLKKVLLIALGTLSVGLGIIGMILPLMPTTCFLLLAAACYARSSERFYHWLMHNRWFGTYLRNYREGRGIPKTTKVFSISMLWLTIGYSALAIVPVLWVKALLILIATGVTYHLIALPTFKQEQLEGYGTGRNGTGHSTIPQNQGLAL